MGRRRKKSSAGSQSLLIPLIFLFIFFCVGLGFFAFLVAIPLWNMYKANDWAKTTAVMELSEIRRHQGDDSVSYSPVVKYRYFVNGQPWTGDRFWFRYHNINNQQTLVDLMQPYQAGAEVDCYYDPQKPSSSVLIRSAKTDWVMVLIPALFMLVPMMIGMGLVAFQMKNRVGNAPNSSLQPAIVASQRFAMAGIPSETTSSGDASTALAPFESEFCPKDAADPHRDQPHLLETQAGRVPAFVFLLFIAAFWNSITFGVLFAFANNDDFSVLTALFLVPFVLIGLALILAAGYYFLKIFNPKPALVCSHSLIYPGSEFELSWTFSGRSQSLSAVKLKLLGIETVTYRLGTSTRTETNTFHEQELIATHDPQEIAEGYVLAKIPEQTMHSFNAKNNKVQWYAEILGEIKRWPDVHEKYELTIYPPRIGKSIEL